MLQLNLENLKKLVRDAKAKSPNRHIYPEIVKNGVAHLLTQMSTKEICKELGLSRNFVETINRLSGKSKDPVVKVSPIKSAPELHFLQMSKKEKKMMAINHL